MHTPTLAIRGTSYRLGFVEAAVNTSLAFWLRDKPEKMSQRRKHASVSTYECCQMEALVSIISVKWLRPKCSQNAT